MLVTTDGSGLFPLLICLLFVVGAVLVATMIARSGRRRSAPPAPPRTPAPPEVPTAQLSDQANAALVAADNALKTSEQELGFAQAQYGAAAVGPFAQALEASRAEVAHAFRLRQQLDDEVPEDEATRRALLREILDRCAAADQRLDAQAEAFDRLRALESTVDTLLPPLGERHERTARRVTAARGAWAEVAGRYAEGALATVADNVSQASDRLTFATAELDQARQALAAGDRGAAAVAVRGAEQSLGQAEALLDAVDTVVADLEAARAALPGLIADVQADAAAGRAAAAAAGSSGGDQVALVAAVARADQVVADARADLAAPRPDPIGTLRRLEGVTGELGAALGGVRDAATRARHAREQLDQAMLGARSTVDAATEFITNRRGAVGAQARTRLAEAQRRLDEAAGLAASDPVAAVAAARSAQNLAEQAAAAARDDVTRWSMPSRGGFGPSVVIGGGGGLTGAVLGGILLDGVFGGVRSTYPARRGLLNGGNGAHPGPSAVGRFGGPSTWTRHHAAE